MSLRTYALITHPAHIKHVEALLYGANTYDGLIPASVPQHRPRLEDINDIATFLGVSPDIIRRLLRSKSKHYQSFSFEKRLGGSREINAPKTFLKVVQWWILDTILENSYTSEFSYGFMKGRSFIDNAKKHLGARHILNVDIQDFFDNITSPSVVSIFLSLGYPPAVSIKLAELTTLEGRLPQGAPTSPMLSNLAFAPLDVALSQLSSGFGATYTRYADDLTFSSSAHIPQDFPDKISEVILSMGLNLNAKKTRFMGPNDTREVTGIIVSGDAIALGKKYLNSARGWFHSISRNPELHQKNIDKIYGTLNFIESVGGRGTNKVIELGYEALRSVGRPKEKMAK